MAGACGPSDFWRSLELRSHSFSILSISFPRSFMHFVRRRDGFGIAATVSQTGFLKFVWSRMSALPSIKTRFSVGFYF